MMWTVCIEGRGQGCDYTIACNKEFYSYKSEATTPEEFAKDLHKHLGDDDGVVYMSACHEGAYESNTYESVSVAPAELVDISDLLVDSINKEREEEEAYQKANDATERALYKRLHNKYGNE